MALHSFYMYDPCSNVCLRLRSNTKLQPFLKGTLTTFANTYAHLSKHMLYVLLIDLARRLSATLMSRLMLNLHQTANTPTSYSRFESRFRHELADSTQPASSQNIVLDDPTVNGRTNLV